jgi:hypothetical protein
MNKLKIRKTTLVEKPLTIDEWFKCYKVSTRYNDDDGFNDHIAFLKRIKYQENNSNNFDWPKKNKVC